MEQDLRYTRVGSGSRREMKATIIALCLLIGAAHPRSAFGVYKVQTPQGEPTPATVTTVPCDESGRSRRGRLSIENPEDLDRILLFSGLPGSTDQARRDAYRAYIEAHHDKQAAFERLKSAGLYSQRLSIPIEKVLENYDSISVEYWKGFRKRSEDFKRDKDQLLIGIAIVSILTIGGMVFLIHLVLEKKL